MLLCTLTHDRGVLFLVWEKSILRSWTRTLSTPSNYKTGYNKLSNYQYWTLNAAPPPTTRLLLSWFLTRRMPRQSTRLYEPVSASLPHERWRRQQLWGFTSWNFLPSSNSTALALSLQAEPSFSFSFLSPLVFLSNQPHLNCMQPLAHRFVLSHSQYMLSSLTSLSLCKLFNTCLK